MSHACKRFLHHSSYIELTFFLAVGYLNHSHDIQCITVIDRLNHHSTEQIWIPWFFLVLVAFRMPSTFSFIYSLCARTFWNRHRHFGNALGHFEMCSDILKCAWTFWNRHRLLENTLGHFEMCSDILKSTKILLSLFFFFFFLCTRAFWMCSDIFRVPRNSL